VRTVHAIVAVVLMLVPPRARTNGPAFLLGTALDDRAAKLLDELKTWAARNNTAIMAVLCLIMPSSSSATRSPASRADRAGASRRPAAALAHS
jgi:hypothetical protein